MADFDTSDFQPEKFDSSDFEMEEPKASWLGAAKGVGEVGLAMGAGTLRGVTHAINDLVPEAIGGKGSRAALDQKINQDPILSYQPQTEEGKYLMAHIQRLTAPIGEAANTAHDYLARLTSPRTADVAGDILALAPFAMRDFKDIKGMAQAGDSAIEQGHPLASAAEGEQSRLGEIRSRAEAAGFDLPEGGTAARHEAAAVNNRPLVNATARDELDLPKNAPLTPEMLAKGRAANASPAYQAIQSLPDKIPLSAEHEATMADVGDLLPSRIRAKIPESGEITGQQAVELTKVLRNRANQLDKATGITASGDIPADIARAHRDLAETIEDSVREHLKSTGRESLADDWEKARVYTAKSYSVESALDGAGNVRASDLKTQLFKKGKPLSGGLEDIANLAAQHPEAFKISRVTQPAPGVVRKAVAGALPAIGAGLGGYFGGGVGGFAGERTGHAIGEKVLGSE